MKVYKEDKPKKSWSIMFGRNHGDVALYAVDTTTGEVITCIMYIYDKGEIVGNPFVDDDLEKLGYDPKENNTGFDGNGIKIITAKELTHGNGTMGLE